MTFRKGGDIWAALESLFSQLFLALRGMRKGLGKGTYIWISQGLCDPSWGVFGGRVGTGSLSKVPLPPGPARTQGCVYPGGKKCCRSNLFCLITWDSFQELLQLLAIVLWGAFLKTTVWQLVSLVPQASLASRHHFLKGGLWIPRGLRDPFRESPG